MKTKLVLSAVLGCGLLASGLSAAAQGNGNLNVQTYKAQFTLAGTPEAPPRAKGKAQLQSQTSEGEGVSTLTLQVQGLEPGEYAVQGVRASDGSTAELGTVVLEDTGGNSGSKGTFALEIPAEVEAADITRLMVSSGGTELLVGDLAEGGGKSKASLNATVPVIAGEAAPEATGFAKLKSSVRKGTVKNNFILVASGVAPETTFTVQIDGADVATATSNKKGKVIVKKLPAEVTSIGTVRLVDDTGAEALRAEF